MPVVDPTGAPMPRAMLGYDGTDFYVVRTDATGNLQIDVLASALPAGAATAANQATMITALQLIDNLYNALVSVGLDTLDVRRTRGTHFGLSVTDAVQDMVAIYGVTAGGAQYQLEADAGGRLSVRGEDQHFSMKGVLAELYAGAPSGAGGNVLVGPVPAGEYWVVTNVVVRDNTTGLTAIYYTLIHDGVAYDFGNVTRAVAIGERVPWGGHVYADPGDYIQAWLIGSLAADSCNLWVTGHRMTVEA